MEELEFAYKKPRKNPARVSDIKTISAKGPWRTKSEADLMVLFKTPYAEAIDYLTYEQDELDNIPEDIRGLRSYSVRGLKKEAIGGTEFHRIRKEILLGLDGLVKLECEDVYGNKAEFMLDKTRGIYIQPFIFHTYQTIEDGGLLVLANTLFNPEDKRTHDSYSLEVFRKLQEYYVNQK